MRNFNLKHLAIAVAAFAVATIALLWSWNTLAGLFGAPVAEYRHVVALLVTAITVRSLVTRRRIRQWHS